MRVILLLCLVLSGCAQQNVIRDTLLPSEVAVPGSAYSLEDLLFALPADYWEIDTSIRRERIRESLKDNAESYVEIEGSGAQPDLQVLRIAPRSLAIVSGSTIADFGDRSPLPHQFGYRVTVLRRVPHGWQDDTKTVFPFPLPAHANAALHRDGTLDVSTEHHEHTERYIFDGTRFVKRA
jgi:hypothetical protein